MLVEATDLTKEFPRARTGGRLFTAVHPLDLTLDAAAYGWDCAPGWHRPVCDA